jgi:endonuclease/exonuclease/phosphatase family metal-dependent hydrolase
MGDFNIRKNHAAFGRSLYYNLTGNFRDNNNLVSTEYISRTPVTTGGSTSNGFRPEWTQGQAGDAIDYIFVNDHFQVESYRVDRVVEGDVFISDHWPVVSIVSFTK